jgi:hypothetical protein
MKDEIVRLGGHSPLERCLISQETVSCSREGADKQPPFPHVCDSVDPASHYPQLRERMNREQGCGKRDILPNGIALARVTNERTAGIPGPCS